MRLIRFRQDPDESWTYCSFAGPDEESAQALLAGDRREGPALHGSGTLPKSGEHRLDVQSVSHV